MSVYVRNLLRNGGFDYGSEILDHIWSGLLEAAVRRKIIDAIKLELGKNHD